MSISNQFLTVKSSKHSVV